jgi:hypothetical protein
MLDFGADVGTVGRALSRVEEEDENESGDCTGGEVYVEAYLLISSHL